MRPGERASPIPDGPILLGRRDVSRLLGPAECIAAVEEAFRSQGRGTAAARGILAFPYPGGGFHIKAAGLERARPYFAVEVNGNCSGNPKRDDAPRDGMTGMRTLRIVLFVSALLAASPGARGAGPEQTSVRIPGGESGIGFDDLGYSASLRRVLAPAGRTGALALIDPAALTLEKIGGFSATARFSVGHGEGITSVSEGDRRLFVTDRDARELDVVDPAIRKIVGRAKLASSPDYVRFVAATREVWVTEPDAERIEIFRVAPGESDPTPAGFLSVAGGPESLLVDSERGRAYTNLWSSTTLSFDLKSRREVSRWENGCRGSRGLALDAARGFLFVGCAEGRAVSLDASSGRVLDRLDSGAGVDIIAFDPSLSHLYLPGGKSATMAILEVSPQGKLGLVRTVETAAGGHCVVSDGAGHVFVCDPGKGRLLAIRDAPARQETKR